MEKENKKVALITGASRGIGAEIARKFAQKGFNLVLTYLNSEESALKVESEVKNLGADVLLVKCDIANEEDVKNLVIKAIEKFNKIDVLVNNAGIAIDTVFDEKTVENFRRTLDVNLIGTFLVSKYVGTLMKQNKYGKIVNLTSTNGINTYFPMCLDYDASKAGIISLTHNLAMQFSPYVSVNAVAPGFIATQSEIEGLDEEFIKYEEDKIMLKRAGTEEDVANLVYSLTSEEASFINNEVIRVDGGIYGNF